MEDAIVTPRERDLTVGNIFTIPIQMQAVFPFLSTIKHRRAPALSSPPDSHRGIDRRPAGIDDAEPW